MTVTVATVSWNTRDLLQNCLRSLRPEVESGRAEVWVVDNASSDGSPELVATEFPWVSLVVLDRNVGFGPAVNLVAARTGRPFIAPANADAQLQPGALQALIETAQRHPAAAVVAPRLVLPDGTIQQSVHAFPTFGYTILRNLPLGAVSPRLADRLCFNGYWDPHRPREVDWAVGAFLLVRRAAFDEVGGFDAEQWMYAEDLDLGWRLNRAGWIARYEPRAVVRHVESAATKQAFGDERDRLRTAATYGWLRKRRGAWCAAAVAAVNLLGAAVRYALLVPLGAIQEERYARARDMARWWVTLHRDGWRSRSAS